MRPVLALAGLCAIGLATPAEGQQGESPDALFRELFPTPTGRNGYEEIVAGGQALGRSERWIAVRSMEAGKATLTQKRAVLNEPPVRRALEMLRAGLNKPLHAPSGQSPDLGLKALGLYRDLGRLLSIEIYVLCADGRTGQAVESLRDACGWAMRCSATRSSAARWASP